MNLTKLGVQFQKFASDNSPLILTTVGAAGTVATAVLTYRSTIKAVSVVKEANAVRVIMTKEGSELPPPYTRLQEFKLTWMCYIPPVLSCGLTIGAIVMANRISMKRMAALAAAYSLSEKRFDEYKEKIVEKLGINKERAARDELAQDRMDKNPPTTSQIMMITAGDVLCFDQFTGRYFKSDMETIRRAENETDREILTTGYASLSSFYERVGLPATSFSEDVGWTENQKVELQFSSVLSPEGKPCISFDFNIEPIRKHGKYLRALAE